MPFTPPKTKAYRRFVILDGPSILAALSAEDGGAVDEILTKRTAESGHDLGGEVGPAAVARARAKRGKSQRVEEELRRVRTEHSAAATLIDRLHERQAIGRLEGPLDEATLDQVEPGMLVELSGEVVLHPLFQLETVMKSFLAVAPKLGQAEEVKAVKGVLPMLQALTGSADSSGRVLFYINTGEAQAARLVAFAARGTLQVPLEDITGRFSALVQVDELLTRPDDDLVTLRLVRGARPGRDEREGIRTATQPLSEAADAMGVAIGNDDLIMPSPLVVFRPLCVWR